MPVATTVVERREAVGVVLLLAEVVRVRVPVLLLLLLVVQDEEAPARLDLRHRQYQVGRRVHLNRGENGNIYRVKYLC